MTWLRSLVLTWAAFAASAAAAAEPNTLADKDKAEGWTLLFDGKTLAGWAVEGGGQWKVADGILVCEAGEDGWLRSKEIYTDFALTLEFRNIPRGNSGVFLRAAKGGKPYPAPENGYELQINNEEEKYATGSIEDYIQRLKPVNPKPNEWHALAIDVRGDHFTVTLDGDTVLDGKSDKFKSGHVGLQFHKESKIEFRSLKLKTPTR